MAGDRQIGIAVSATDTISVIGGLDSTSTVRALKLASDGSIGKGLLPSGATQLANSSGNVANASAVATLTSAASRTAWISGFELTAGGATAGSLVTATVTGLTGGTLSYTFAAPTGAAVGATPLVVTFDPPLQASAANTNIVVTLPALGAGNTNATATAHGFLI